MIIIIILTKYNHDNAIALPLRQVVSRGYSPNLTNADVKQLNTDNFTIKTYPPASSFGA